MNTQARSTTACFECQEEIHGTHYRFNDRPVCEQCEDSVRDRLVGAGGMPGRFVRAFIAGTVGAVAGSASYWGVALSMGWEVGLVSLLVGYMTGKAVSWGSRGRGGFGYQLLAVALTYVAITCYRAFGDWGRVDLEQLWSWLQAPWLGAWSGHKVLRVAIIGFGLYEAFSLNRTRPVHIEGPLP